RGAEVLEQERRALRALARAAAHVQDRPLGAALHAEVEIRLPAHRQAVDPEVRRQIALERVERARDLLARARERAELLGALAEARVLLEARAGLPVRAFGLLVLARERVAFHLELREPRLVMPRAQPEEGQSQRRGREQEHRPAQELAAPARARGQDL